MANEYKQLYKDSCTSGLACLNKDSKESTMVEIAAQWAGDGRTATQLLAAACEKGFDCVSYDTKQTLAVQLALNILNSG